MRNFYRLRIFKTSKKAGRYSDDTFDYYDTEVKTFKTLQEVEDYLKEQYFYFKGKKSTIYQDTEDGKSKEVGKIYHYKEKLQEDDYQQKTYYLQDWITIEKVQEKTTPILSIL